MLKALLIHGLLESRLNSTLHSLHHTDHALYSKLVFSTLRHIGARTLPKICNNPSSLNKNGGSPTSWDIICNVFSLPMAAGYTFDSISA